MKLIGTFEPVVSVFGLLRYNADISMPLYSLASDKQKRYAYVTFIIIQSCSEAIGCLSRPSSCTWYLICPTDSEIKALHISVI
jgi:hypothetical protein